MNKQQTEIATSADLPLNAVKSLARGATWEDSYRSLLQYYEEAGLEVTGWGHPVTGKYYGVGVRWKTSLQSNETR